MTPPRIVLAARQQQVYLASMHLVQALKALCVSLSHLIPSSPTTLCLSNNRIRRLPRRRPPPPHTIIMKTALVLVAAAATLSCTLAFVPPAPVVSRQRSAVRMMAATKPKPPTSGVDDKTEVREYFNTEGFQRWNRIYSEDGTVNKVQADIRVGHQQTVDKILGWLEADGVKGESICDAGCGVGSLAIPMAQLGAKVSASDISSSMANEGKVRAEAVLGKATAKARCTFSTSDLEALKGKYDTVTCVDVMIHYPTDKMQGMVSKLGSLAKKRMIISFAPKTWYYDILKQIGGLFPGPSKTTRAYLHPEADVRKALEDAGFTVRRTEMTGTNFYFSRLLEAVRE